MIPLPGNRIINFIRQHFSFLAGHSSNIETILGVLFLQAFAGGYNPFSAGWQGYFSPDAYRRGEISLLPGPRNGQ